MELEIFTLCDYAVESQPGKLTFVGTFDTIFCQNIPVIHPSCSLALRLRVANKEAGIHALELIFQSPSGNEISKIDGELEFRVNEFANYSTTNFVINFGNLELSELGTYTFELRIDGEFMSGLSMHVTKIDPSQIKKVA
ncbi:DUF6941 family protein [Litoribacter populi]|uniref:DUF6941 family protein n=1 Tax=Litoribacter populi TaxID=2598460 RepID=UPI00117F7CDC|nr:hypothetical protein [Litoribacter populi]